MLVKMETGASGGTPEWILDATISGTSFSASWDFDAETILIFITTNNIKSALFYDVATKDLWYADTYTAKWSHYGVDTRLTITPRSVSGGYGQTISNLSILPIANKPNGYFT